MPSIGPVYVWRSQSRQNRRQEGARSRFVGGALGDRTAGGSDGPGSRGGLTLNSGVGALQGRAGM